MTEHCVPGEETELPAFRIGSPIVHIGFPKTGTTWFQKSFYRNLRWPIQVPRKRINAALLSGNALTFDPAKCRSILGLSASEPALLCEEGLCGYLHNGGVDAIVTKEVAHRINAALPDAHIVIFIRSQTTALVSAYLQYLRAGGTHGPQRYFFPKQFLKGSCAVTYKQPRFDIDFFLYSRIIDLYDSLFGRDRVHVFLFEDFEAGGVAFLGRYAAALRLEVDWDAVSLEPRLTSYGPGLAHLARFFNLFTARSVLDKRTVLDIPGWYHPRRAILELLNRSRLFGQPVPLERLIGPKLADELAAHYARDNEIIAQTRNLGLREARYPFATTGPNRQSGYCERSSQASESLLV